MNIYPSTNAQPSVYQRQIPTHINGIKNKYRLSIEIENHSIFFTKEQSIHLRNKLNAALRKLEQDEFKKDLPLTENKENPTNK